MTNKETETGADNGWSQEAKATVLILLGVVFVFFGWYSIDVTWKEKDPVEMVLESLPSEQQSLKNLTAQLVEHDQRALQEIISEQGDDLWMQEAKSNYPERFIVSPQWFGSMAHNKEIPGYQVGKLIEKVEKEPLSTNDAAYWVLEVSRAPRSEGAHDEQKRGISGLRAAGVPTLEGEVDAQQAALMALASMFIELKSAATSPEVAAFKAKVAGKTCDVEVSLNVPPESKRWVVTKLNCDD